MLRHQLAAAERERPRAHSASGVAGPGVAGAACRDGTDEFLATAATQAEDYLQRRAGR